MVFLSRHFDSSGENDVTVVSLPNPYQLSRVLKERHNRMYLTSNTDQIRTLATQGNLAVPPLATVKDCGKLFISGITAISDSLKSL